MIEQYNELTISQATHTKWAGKTVHFAREINSTNLWVKELAGKGAAHGTLAVTEFQSAGRGRLGRQWQAPEGSSVMMTLLLKPEFEPQYASMLTLVMGLSVAQAVEGLGLKAEIKWPNDVVVSKKKICGILTEMSAGSAGINYVAVGVGINVNIPEFPQELADKATSLFLEKGTLLNRSQVIASVMECFETNYDKFVQTLNLFYLKEEYQRLLVNTNKPVKVLDPLGAYEGISLGINEKGELLVQKEDGSTVCVGAGEVSVRGLYSYV